MKHIEYSCDWCGLRAPSPSEDDWPDGWTSPDGDYVMTDDVICPECITELKESIAQAKARRVALNPNPPAPPAPPPVTEIPF